MARSVNDNTTQA